MMMYFQFSITNTAYKMESQSHGTNKGQLKAFSLYKFFSNLHLLYEYSCYLYFLGAKASLGLAHVKKRGVTKKFQNSNILISSTHRWGYC